MRKTKANLKRQSSGQRDPIEEERIQAEREQRFQEIEGESATEGVGPGFTNTPDFEASIQTADGPLAGDSLAPAADMEDVQRTGKTRSEKRKMTKKKVVDRSAGNHTAARSPKKI
ncbi:MAG TPA: hypothetical protein VEK08_06730 [Planctomycetota bacterium]|nr:hypothetical protein [Planctomycetota bacterium]